MVRKRTQDQTWMMREFGAGLDRRAGVFSRNHNEFLELTNALITDGRQIERRPPQRSVDGSLNSCQGLINFDGDLITFNTKAPPDGPTGDVSLLVTVYEFDIPNGHGATWELLEALVHDGVVCALIRHFRDDPLMPHQDMLHVWDDAPGLPTYVTDPFVPTSLSASRPLHVYRDNADLDELPMFSDYTPTMASGQGKLWITTARGDVRSCATRGLTREYNLRVWNQFTPDEILEYGEWFYYIAPNDGGGVRNFDIPVAFDDLAPDRRYSAYVAEYQDVEGKWQKFPELATLPAPTGATQYAPSSLANPWHTSSVELPTVTRISFEIDPATETAIRNAGMSPVVRWRGIVGDPPLKILDGDTTITSGAGGAPVNIPSTGPNYPFPQQYSLGVPAGDFTGTLTLDGVELPWEPIPTDLDAGVGAVFGGGGIEHVRLGKWNVSASNLVQQMVPGTLSRHSAHLKVYENGVHVPAATIFESGGLVYVSGVDGYLNVVEVFLNPDVGVIIGVTFGALETESGGNYSWEGENFEYGTITVDPLAANKEYLLTVTKEPGIVPYLSEITDPSNPIGHLNGYERYHARIFRVLQTNGAGDIANGPDVGGIQQGVRYYYGHEENPNPSANDQSGYQSNFYLRQSLILEPRAGAIAGGLPDAIELNTSREDNTGGPVLAIGAIKNRMMFFYEKSSQLWQIDVDPGNNLFLDQMTFGILPDDFGTVTEFYGGLIVPTPLGYRSVTLAGTNFDSMRDLGIGEPISEFFPLAMRDSVFWPHMGLYVSGVVDDSEDWFHIFNFSRNAKISAWSRWQVNALGAPNKNGLVPVGDRLYVVVGNEISYFDASATVYRDDNDPVGEDAYESLAVFHFNDFRRPGDNKRLLWMDWAIAGEAAYGFRYSPQDLDVEWRDIVSADTEITYGLTRIPLGYLVVPGVAPAIRSVDETGWRLDQISISFQYLRRY